MCHSLIQPTIQSVQPQINVHTICNEIKRFSKITAGIVKAHIALLMQQ